MIPAIHFVHGGSKVLSAILNADEILPAIDRINGLAVRQICGNLDATLQHADPRAYQAFQDLLDERLLDIQEHASGTWSEFRCEDILAGDLGRVFLSLAEWPEIYKKHNKNGIVFVAEDLVKRGAAIRYQDLLPEYESALQEFFESASRKTVDVLERALDKVRRKGEIRGAAALAYLRLGEFEGTEEVVVDGPLSLDRAEQIWRDGEMEWSETMPPRF
jgi:hypothetical protein